NGLGVLKHGQDTRTAPADSVYAGGHRARALGRGHHDTGREPGSVAGMVPHCRPRCGRRHRSALQSVSGGALENCAVFSLGIMPYISASIMMQLLTAVIPQLGRLAREDGGRQKIMQYTRFMTVGLCIFQGYLLALSFQHPESYHTMLPGITDTIRNLGIPLVEDTGWVFRIGPVF